MVTEEQRKEMRAIMKEYNVTPEMAQNMLNMLRELLEETEEVVDE